MNLFYNINIIVFHKIKEICKIIAIMSRAITNMIHKKIMEIKRKETKKSIGIFVMKTKKIQRI